MTYHCNAAHPLHVDDDEARCYLLEFHDGRHQGRVIIEDPDADEVDGVVVLARIEEWPALCSAPNPTRFYDDGARCRLPAGHDGWHRSTVITEDPDAEYEVDGLVLLARIEEWPPDAYQHIPVTHHRKETHPNDRRCRRRHR